jgi:hypothetical protein
VQADCPQGTANSNLSRITVSRHRHVIYTAHLMCKGQQAWPAPPWIGSPLLVHTYSGHNPTQTHKLKLQLRSSTSCRHQHGETQRRNDAQRKLTTQRPATAVNTATSRQQYTHTQPLLCCGTHAVLIAPKPARSTAVRWQSTCMSCSTACTGRPNRLRLVPALVVAGCVHTRAQQRRRAQSAATAG